MQIERANGHMFVLLPRQASHRQNRRARRSPPLANTLLQVHDGLEVIQINVVILHVRIVGGAKKGACSKKGPAVEQSRRCIDDSV